MQITCLLSCRADNKIYQLIQASNIPSSHSIVPAVEITDLVSSVPFHLYSFETNDESQKYVAVLPDLPIQTGSIRFAEINENGTTVDTQNMSVDFPKAKWLSRINYKIRPRGCRAIRLFDQRVQQDSKAELSIVQAISTTTHVLLRIEEKHCKVDNGDNLEIMCLDSSLNVVASDYIILHSTDFPSKYENNCITVRNTISLKIPWNLGDFFLVARINSLDSYTAILAIKQHELESRLAETDKLFYLEADSDPYYSEWLANNRPNSHSLDMQRKKVFGIQPTFSIIVPLYKTPISYFKEMVDSVVAQTYSKWELILVNSYPEKALTLEIDKAIKADDRIRVVTLTQNLGISENTNRGIEVAQGDYVSFLDHDDFLEPNTLYEYVEAINKKPNSELLYCDEDKVAEDGIYFQPFFKPDFSIDLLRNNNYICHMLTIKKTLLDRLELSSKEFDGAQDHNLTLQAVEKTNNITHVPKVLYHWRVSPSSTSSNSESKPYAIQSGIQSVKNHLKRLNISAEVSPAERPFTYHVRYCVPEPKPKVSIIIPNKNSADYLSRCIESILSKTTYQNYEILIVENGSTDSSIFKLYEKLLNQHPDIIRVITWEDGFNFSAIVNFGVNRSAADYFVLLNNDTELITPDWLETLVGLCSRDEVGAVGVKLLYPDNTIQHAGINISGDAGHYFKDLPNHAGSYFNMADTPRNLSAVTAACMITKRKAFESVGGFGEEFAVAYNDVDYCLKLRDRGYLIVYTPSVELYHYESISRGYDEDFEGRARNLKEKALLVYRWPELFASHDPYYTPNLRMGLPDSCYYRF